MPRTYLDTGVLISAFKGTESTSEAAMAIIADEERTFVVSDVLALECVAEPRRMRFEEQAQFCESFIAENERVPVTDAATHWAIGIYSRHSIQLVDLLHMAVAVHAGAEEFVTTEASTKPFFTIGAPLNVVSIHEPEADKA
jgi:predicted nucleic acid-binding protein